MKIIVYKSFLGTARLYAEWLSRSTNTELYPIELLPLEKFRRADSVAIISGTYFLTSPIIGFTKEHWDILKDKGKVILVNVGAISEGSFIRRLIYNSLPEKIRSKISYYDLRGKIGKILSSKVKISNMDKIIEEFKAA